MPLVIFTCPWFSDTAHRYIEAATSLLDVQLGVISETPLETMAPQLQKRIAGHWRVPSVLDASQVAWAARELSQRHGPIHRIFSGQEQVQVVMAQVREWLGIRGADVQTALNFRDKARMKAIFQAHGLPCARHRLVASPDDAWAFAAETGFPLVVKPPAGAASQSTFRVDTPEALGQALTAAQPSQDQPALLEEFIVGSEHSFDCYVLDGQPLFHSLTHYYPSPLEVLNHPWMQWTVVLPREIDVPEYDDIRDAAFRALHVLGMGTGMTHMEWFRRRDGSLAISEIAARPPGAQFTTLISRAHDFDAVQAWVRLLVYETFDPPTRKYAAGGAYLRGMGEGRVKAVNGLDQVYREVGHLVTDFKVPQVGQPKAESYEGEGYIIVRHPETEVVRRALERIVSLARVELAE